MNTKAELQWWIEFAQKDLGRVREKTLEKLFRELKIKMEKYGSFWGAGKYEFKILSNKKAEKLSEKRENLEKYQQATILFVNDLKKILAGEMGKLEKNGKYIKIYDNLKVSFRGYVSQNLDGKFFSIVIDGSTRNEQIYFYLGMLMNGTDRADYKNCEYCGNLFLQVSREKRFCTRNCAANSVKR